MKRTPFKPGGGLSRSGGIKRDGASSLRSSSPKGGSAAKKPPPSPFEMQREAAKRAALNALKRARRAADKAGVSRSAVQSMRSGKSVWENTALHVANALELSLADLKED